MNCPDIRKFLTEYLEGSLGDQDKKSVEEHLAICKGCSEELASIKAYFKEVGSLEKVKAPEDFLEKVHQRLERRFTFEKIMRTLFVPVRIKIPLELAAVVTTVVLAVFIYRSALPPVQLAVVRDDDIATEALSDEPLPSAKEMKLAEVVREEVASDIKEHPIVIALLVMPEGISGDELSSVPLRKQVRRGFADKVETIEEAPETEVAKRKKDYIKYEKAPRALSADVYNYNEKEEGLRQKTLWDTFLNVRFLVISFEGEIMSIGYDKEKDLPQSITVEIPSKNYNTLLENLDQFGIVQYEPKDTEIIDDEKLVLTIQFKLPR